MRKTHAWSNTLISRIDISGLISILVVLAFALWVHSSTHPDLPGNRGNLPVANHSRTLYGADREDAMMVGIQRDGRIFFDTREVSPDELSFGIRECLKHNPEHKVYLRADSRAKYRTVLLALAAIRAAGIEDVAFLTLSPSKPR